MGLQPHRSKKNTSFFWGFSDIIKAMNTIPHTDTEAEGFEHISDFLYPDNQLDEQALAMFLKGFVSKDASDRHSYYYSSSSNPLTTQHQVQAMGYLLRLMDTTTALWFESFQQWYGSHRMSNGAYFNVWFGMLDEAHKEITQKSMLRMLDGAPAIEIRVALMMDGMEHYRDLPVQTFIGKSLLRVKSAAFVKALKPSIPQMPMVLRMAKELSTSAPEYAKLAQAITMGVFVQRMADKPSNSNPQSEYSACEAFQLVLKHGPVPEAELFVASAKSRFKGSTLLPDMLTFVNWALESDPSRNWQKHLPTEAEKTFASSLMTTLLADLVQDTSNHHFDASLIQAHAVALKSETTHETIVDWFRRRLASSTARNISKASFVYMLDNLFPEKEHQASWELWCKAQGSASLVDLVQNYMTNGAGYYDPDRYFQLLRLAVTTNDLVSVLHKTAASTFERSTHVNSVYRRNGDSDEEHNIKVNQMWLSKMEQFFSASRRLVTDDVRQNESFKQLVAATSMAYLLEGSQASNAKYNPHNGDFVNLLAEPLPLLRSLYPEHTSALNTLRKEIIHTISTSPNAANYHQKLYGVLGRALYTDATVQLETVLGMTKSMDINPLVYFQSCTMQKEVFFEVSGDLFDMGM